MSFARVPSLFLSLFVLGATTAHAASLTAGVVFGANEFGNTYSGLTWNTLGRGDSQPFDVRDNWNVYVSETVAPTAPIFLNGYNDARTNIALPLTPGTVTYGLYGESTGRAEAPGQHYAINLYFGGDVSAPGISALTGPTCALCPAGHPNGTNLFGDTNAPGAGTLTWTDGIVRVTLTQFAWALSTQDLVWSHYHNTAEYPNGSGRADYAGAITLRVEQVPEPAAAALLGLGLPAAWYRRRRR